MRPQPGLKDQAKKQDYIVLAIFLYSCDSADDDCAEDGCAVLEKAVGLLLK